MLIDTPGMRELQLWDTGEPWRARSPTSTRWPRGCRFRDCAHARRARLRRARRGRRRASCRPSGSRASASCATEQAFQATQQDERAQLEQKRQGRIGAKALRKVLKDKGRS